MCISTLLFLSFLIHYEDPEFWVCLFSYLLSALSQFCYLLGNIGAWPYKHFSTGWMLSFICKGCWRGAKKGLLCLFLASTAWLIMAWMWGHPGIFSPSECPVDRLLRWAHSPSPNFITTSPQFWYRHCTPRQPTFSLSLHSCLHHRRLLPVALPMQELPGSRFLVFQLPFRAHLPVT